jgi:hypothetical protein
MTHDSWLIHLSDMTHLYVWYESWVLRLLEYDACIVCVILNAPLFVWHWMRHCLCDMTHSFVQHDAFIGVTRLTHMCDTTHSYVWHDAFMRVTRRIHMRDTTHSYVWHDSFKCVTRLIHMCDTTHSYAPHQWYDACVINLWASLVTHCDTLQHAATHCNYIPIHTATIFQSITDAMPASCVWHDSPICVSWRIHMCDTTHSYLWHDMSCAWHDSCIRMRHDVWHVVCVTYATYVWHVVCVTWFVYTNASWRVTCHVRDVCVIHVTCRVRDMIRLHVQHDAFICVWSFLFYKTCQAGTQSRKRVAVWSTHMCDMTYVCHDSCVWHSSVVCVWHNNKEEDEHYHESELQYEVATLCCSVLQCVAVRGSQALLQCFVVCCSVLRTIMRLSFSMR